MSRKVYSDAKRSYFQRGEVNEFWIFSVRFKNSEFFFWSETSLATFLFEIFGYTKGEMTH